MQVSAGTGVFWRTKIITFTPRFIIVNQLSLPVIYMQKGSLCPTQSIAPNQQVPYHWNDHSKPYQLCIRLAEGFWEWSGGFDIHDIGNFCVKMRHRNGEKSYLARVRIKVDGSTTFVIINPEDKVRN